MIVLVDFGSSKANKIAACVNQLGYSSETIDWKHPETINRSNTTGIILSGAPVLITQTNMDTYLLKYQFLKTLDIPVLGICFGHQLIGLLYGASAFKGEEIRKEITINVTLSEVEGQQKSKLFDGFGATTTMMEDHTEGVTLPPDFILLASSSEYAVEAMKHSKSALFGVQFHPEVSGENGLKLLNNFCQLTN